MLAISSSDVRMATWEPSLVQNLEWWRICVLVKQSREKIFALFVKCQRMKCVLNVVSKPGIKV